MEYVISNVTCDINLLVWRDHESSYRYRTKCSSQSADNTLFTWPRSETPQHILHRLLILAILSFSELTSWYAVWRIELLSFVSSSFEVLLWPRSEDFPPSRSGVAPRLFVIHLVGPTVPSRFHSREAGSGIRVVHHGSFFSHQKRSPSHPALSTPPQSPLGH